MSSWGSNLIGKRPSRRRNPNLGVQKAIGYLSPTARQAMIVAIEHQGNIMKKTWNGCAFNAAGAVVGENVKSYSMAADVFGMSVAEVQMFVKNWDTSSVTTDQLKRMLYNEQLFEEDGKRKPQTYEVRVFTSEETKRREEFEALVKDLNFEDVKPEEEALVSNAHLISELVNA